MNSLTKLKVYIVVVSILVLAFAGAFCWQAVELENTRASKINKIVEYIPQSIYVDREVEKILTRVETSIITEYIEVIPDAVAAYAEAYAEVLETKQAHWSTCIMEYPEATVIWLYLTDTCGYNNYVAAGIMGNLMNETGGNTLALKPDTYGGSSKGYYGICQWSLKYHEEVDGLDLSGQLEYLLATIPTTFDASGALYAKNFDYQAFCNLQDSADAALAFMRVYERPSKLSTTTRKMNALKAYQYFVVDN